MFSLLCRADFQRKQEFAAISVGKLVSVVVNDLVGGPTRFLLQCKGECERGCALMYVHVRGSVILCVRVFSVSVCACECVSVCVGVSLCVQRHGTMYMIQILFLPRIII